MIDAQELRFQVRAVIADGAVSPPAMVRLGDMTEAQRAECQAWCESVMAEPWWVKMHDGGSLQAGLWTEKIKVAHAWLKANPAP